MPAIDEQRFLLKSLLERMIRLQRVANDVESAPTNKNKNLLKVMAVKLDDYHTQYMSNIQKVVAYNFKNGIEEDLGPEIVKFEEPYYNVQAVMAAAFPIEPRLSLDVSTGGCSAGGNLNIQLPKIKLPEFSGEIRKWQAFSELFLATVEVNAQLSDVQKHMYLRSALSGEALSLVAYLPLTGPNYKVCWDTLKKQYDNHHLQTFAHLEAIYSLPSTSLHPSHIRNFASQITESTGALGALGHDVEGWAVPILFLCCKKLNGKLREDWERHLLTSPDPSIQRFTWFLQEQARVLEASRPATDPVILKKSPVKQPPSKGPTTLMVGAGNSIDRCPKCSKSHVLDQCGVFRQTDVHQRLAFVKEKRLCLLCLVHGHFVGSCSRRGTCRYCSGRHHSLLHIRDREPSTEAVQPRIPSQGPASSSMQIYSSGKGGQVLLATARAQVFDAGGRYNSVRVLIDPASQATFMTRSCASKLGLKLSVTEVPVLGMGQVSLGVCRQEVRCHFCPVQSVELQVDALVVDHITCAPSEWVTPLPAERLHGLQLADPDYNKPAAVDMLLGAEWFGCIILEKPIQGQLGAPSLLKSIWGYCVVGRHQKVAAAVQSLCAAVAVEPPSTDALIQRFWELEEPPKNEILSPEDQACHDLYVSTVSRSSSGRYVVALPFKTDHKILGDSRQGALSRFLMLEKRMHRNPALKTHYQAFMRDYLDQGHMYVSPTPARPFFGYYIPHHCIFKQDSNGTIAKFRVVFDSSMTTKNGPSLNQILYKGPKLQAEIIDILLRFRLHEVVLVTDIRQMYRNINLQEGHHDFQRILWRFSPEQPIEEYCLATVTYGVSSSPFLAIRTLHRLVEDEGRPYPMASEALLLDTYMDDVIKSVSSIDEAIQLRSELEQLLGKAGFGLRKWMSNREEVLRSLPPEHCAVSVESLSFDGEGEPSAKILGLVWTPKADLFSYKISDAPSAVTKRLIMSDIAKLFDPIGFVAPVVFMGKCLIRKLWQLGIGWDDRPPDEICERWNRFRRELSVLEQFTLPRWVHFDSHQSVELHGFADSSEQGYAGVVYLRCQLNSGETRVSLVLAKSKVAPVNGHTLPRLELCGIELTTKLLYYVSRILSPFGQPSVTVWSDSTVALHWVKSSPHRWKTFVANRVSACQRRVPPDCYRHVPTSSNPADCASRGLYPQELLNNDLWVSGPSWLILSEEDWPRLTVVEPPDLEGLEARVVCHVGLGPAVVETPFLNIFKQFSSLARLCRVVAWCLRFWNNRVLHRTQGLPLKFGQLTMPELREAMSACCRLVQREVFSKDIDLLENGLNASKPLRKLNPFLDDRGLLRVGGRLRHSGLPYDQKFPVLLPRTHEFTNLIIDHFHLLYLHPGLSNLHFIIHRNFWILSARSAISARVSKCVRCFRSNPRSIQPMMGDLPVDRLMPGRAFEVTGVDYGGPFHIKMNRVRRAVILKSYVCLFVCFTTKAIHLELASSLSTEAFIAALKRFLARRGNVTTIHSDCGTNFVGARNKMEGWKEVVQSDHYNNEATQQLAVRGIEWKLNPPASPHFGGLWESGIKSAKRLLARVIGEQVLTYEEFYTVLVQVEATLNSRPLVPLSPDPNDLQVLTPGHFLMMGPPGALFEEPPPPMDVSPRDRWVLLRQLVASFWKRWSSDYLNTLQLRNKWNRKVPNLKEGMMVILKDTNQPPLLWKIGRIVLLHPGPDGVVRVADVKTATGVYRRSIVHLCPLPEQ